MGGDGGWASAGIDTPALRAGVSLERGLCPRIHRIAFPPLRDIPAEAHPPSPLEAPQPSSSPWEVMSSLEAFMQSHEAPSSLEAFMQRKSSPGFEASGSRGALRGAWPPSRRMSRSGGNAIRLLRGEAALLIHPKREALGVSIRLEGGQAPPTTSEDRGIDHLRRGYVPSFR